MKLDIPKGCREGELQGGYSSTILNSAQALTRRAHTMEGMRKGKNAMVALSPIFNRVTAIENGGTSLYRGNPELIRGSLKQLTSLWIIIRFDPVASGSPMSFDKWVKREAGA